MKSETVSGGLITTGGGIIFTFQGFMQVCGLLVAVAGLVIGFLNWKENKRRNDLTEAQNEKERLRVKENQDNQERES